MRDKKLAETKIIKHIPVQSADLGEEIHSILYENNIRHGIEVWNRDLERAVKEIVKYAKELNGINN